MTDLEATLPIYVKIIGRNDDLSAWDSINPILDVGEIALASINNFLVDTDLESTFMMKIGDGVTDFKSLNWLAAPASDVYPWAKKENPTVADLPIYLSTYLNTLNEKANTAESDIASIEGDIADLRYTIAQDKIDLNAEITRQIELVEDYHEELDVRINNIEEVIEGITGLMHFIGITSTDPATGVITIDGEVYNGVSGDLVIYQATGDTPRDVEYVYSGNAWVELGDVTAEQAAIAQLQQEVAEKASDTDLQEFKNIAVTVGEQSFTDNQKVRACDNIGAIRAPLTAEVGQIIKVSEVDENGAPRKWEAANLPVDTGWVTLPLNKENAQMYGAPDATAEEYAASNVRTRYRAIGSVVQIQGVISPLKPTATNGSGRVNQSKLNITGQPLPPELRPSMTLEFVCQGSYVSRWLLSVGADGYIAYSRLSDLEYTTTKINNTTVVTSVKQDYKILENPETAPNWFPFSVSYIAEN